MKSIRVAPWLVALLVGIALMFPTSAGTQAVQQGLSYLTAPTLSVLDQSSMPPPVATDVPLGDGAGAFGTRSFTYGDINGDGLNDLLVSPGYGRYLPFMPLQIWINQGNGRFVDHTTDLIAGPVPVINSAQIILIADFNGDGRADIVIVESGLEDTNPPRGGRVLILLSQPNGKLAAGAADGIAGNAASHYQSAAMGDVNGDGALDIVLSRPCQRDFEGCGVLFLLNDGQGHFRPSVAGLPPQIAHFAFVSPPAPGCCTTRYPFQNPNAVGIGDLDGDGRLDLVTGSGAGGDDFNNVVLARTIRVHQQQVDGTFIERVRSPIPAAIQNVGYVSDQRTPDNPAGLIANQFEVADLNGDGRPDIVVLWEGSSSHIEILRNDGNFQFTDVTLAWFGTYVTGRDRTNVGLFRVVDANSDGYPDLVFGTPAQSSVPADYLIRSFVFLNDGTGRFSPWTLRLRGAAPTAETLAALIACDQCNGGSMPMLFDANGDGLPDVVLIKTRITAARPTREQILFLYTFLAEPDQPIRSLPAPTGLASRVDGNAVTISWRAVARAASYDVQAGSRPGLADLAVMNTTAVGLSATAGSGTYFVRLRTKDAAGVVGQPSDEIVVKVGATSSCSAPPGAPASLQASTARGVVILSWTAPAGPVTSYVLEAGSALGRSDLANTDLASAATSLTAAGVAPGIYYVRLRAKNLCGVGVASGEITVNVHE